MNDLRYLALSVFLTWAMLMTASLLRAKAWSPRRYDSNASST